MSDLQILVVFVGVLVALILWYRYGGGRAFLANVPTYGDLGGGGGE